MQNKKIIKKILMVSLILFCVFILVFFFALLNGQVNVFTSLFSSSDNLSPFIKTIIFKIRLPRILTAAVVGASLSLGGVVFQTILKNPLSEPYILGISGGSAVGAIIGILLNLAYFPWISSMAFIGGMVTLFFILLFSFNRFDSKTILLTGVMINAFCSAIILFIISFVKDARLNHVILWLMGDLSTLTIENFYTIFFCNLPCFIIIFFFASYMNLFFLGENTAQTMGVNVKKIKIVLLVITSFMISNTVAICGLLGFVGLLIPHILRKILGADNRVIIPASILLGASYMVFCDTLVRIIPTESEMPSGVITALIGAPVFIILLKKHHKI